MQVVIYDEIEKFHDYDHAQFEYPYEKRKNSLLAFEYNNELPLDAEGENYDYTYRYDAVKFRVSQVCLEADYFAQLNIFKDFIPAAEGIWNGIAGSSSSTADDEFACGNTFFNKIKYESHAAEDRRYATDYERGIIDERILYQLVLGQDQFKTTSVRQSTQILDYFGDLGGFYQAIDILIFMFGQYFSAKFFIQNVAQTLFIRKKTASELSQSGKKKFDSDSEGSDASNIEDPNLSTPKVDKRSLGDETRQTIFNSTQYEASKKAKQTELVDLTAQRLNVLVLGKAKKDKDFEKAEPPADEMVFEQTLQSLKQRYASIRFQTVNLVFDPMLVCLSYPFS